MNPNYELEDEILILNKHKGVVVDIKLVSRNKYSFFKYKIELITRKGNKIYHWLEEKYIEPVLFEIKNKKSWLDNLIILKLYLNFQIL